MEKLLIIDGSGLLVANYYGTLPKEVQYAKTDEEKESNFGKITQKNGYYINAIYPTIKQILEYIIESKTDYTAICFDKSRKSTFRKEIYKDYKSNRKETPIPLKEQFILCEKLLIKMGLPVFFHDRYEADDIAGSISKQFPNLDKIILSKDKDYLQLVDDKSIVWMMLSKKEIANEILESYAMTKDLGYEEYLPEKVVPFDLSMVKSEKGIDAKYFYEVLALAGDSSDNIPGVKGVSEQTAQKLIGYYNTINALYDDIDKHLKEKTIPKLKEQWKTDLKLKKSPYNALMDYKKEAFLSSKLAKIKTDIDLNELIEDFSIDNLKITGFVQYLINNYTEFNSTIRQLLHREIDKLIEENSELIERK